MPEKFRPSRIGDVAKLAGVSTATVSYVLNNRGNISFETAERVRQAAKTLHYHASAQGRFLVRGQSETIGVVVPESMARAGTLPSPLLSGLIAACQHAGYHLMVLAPEGSQDIGAYLEGIARSHRVDGVVLIYDADLEGAVQILQDERVPCVVYGAEPEACTWYNTDNKRGAVLATEHLVELGHQRIVHLAGPDMCLAAHQRREGYEEVLAAHQIEPWAVLGPMTVQSGYERTYSLLTAPGRPSAIFAVSDAVAMGALQCAGDIGIHVPRQLSVVGFGNEVAGRHASPPLTTVEHDLVQAGERLAAMLISRITGEDVLCERVRPVLRVRESTGVPAVYQTPRTNPQEPVLKAGAAFAVLSTAGRIEADSLRQGIYLYDTRMVSTYQWRIDSAVPAPLAMRVTANSLSARYVFQHSGMTRFVMRTLRLSPQGLEDHWSWRHYGTAEPWTLSLAFDADFTDIFELRGSVRRRAGSKTVSRSATEARYRYEGLDGVARQVVLQSSRPAEDNASGQWEWPIGEEEGAGSITLKAVWDNPVPELNIPSVREETMSFPRFEWAHQPWQNVTDRSCADMEMLATNYGHGVVPMAGIPWFGTFFGRDAIIASYQVLAWAPAWAYHTLSTLAAWQGTQDIAETEEEPGKMVHEIRLGEMARTGEVPFARYYGSVDVTPLFLGLLVDTWRRTGDDGLMARLLPSAERALGWLIQAQDRNRWGLISFSPRSSQGLAVQSWKDSSDSMVFANGDHAAPPLAVAEVQGYVYRAFRAMAEYYRAAGNAPEAKALERRAAKLKKQFDALFWMPDQQYYALAVDGQGRAVDAMTSDPGQCLWSGIVPQAKTQMVADALLSPDLYSGWGIRTLAASQSAYDPYSYHRGSVWPHDTSLVAAGLQAAGATSQALELALSLMRAASRFPWFRLPELFAGESSAQQEPVPYPEACAPQAWASAAPLHLVQTLLGLEIDARQRTIRCLATPPDSLGAFTIETIPLTPGLAFTLSSDGRRVKATDMPPQWTFHAVGRRQEGVKK